MANEHVIVVLRHLEWLESYPFEPVWQSIQNDIHCWLILVLHTRSLWQTGHFVHGITAKTTRVLGK